MCHLLISGLSICMQPKRLIWRTSCKWQGLGKKKSCFLLSVQLFFNCNEKKTQLEHNGNEQREKNESNGFEGNAIWTDSPNEISFHLHAKCGEAWLLFFLLLMNSIFQSFETSRSHIQMKLKMKSIIPEGITKWSESKQSKRLAGNFN